MKLKVAILLFLVVMIGMAVPMFATGDQEISMQKQDYPVLTEEALYNLSQTTVFRDETSPTGYTVAFRYVDKNADRVRLYGEWRFSSIEDASYFSSTNAGPEAWQDGYTVWKTDSWPTIDMIKDETTGVWSYTIPLPTGTWCYRYYVGGAGNDLTDFTDTVMVADPANVNYLANPDETGKEHLLTAVYVPWDPEKQANTPTRFEEAPRSGQNGSVMYETTSIQGIETSYAIYLPFGYDKNRNQAYPVMVLFHGGGGYYGSWFTNGLVNILDNMIAEGRLEPSIVVTPNGSDFSHPEFRWDRPLILDYVVNEILPNMTENYNASANPKRRAFAGLSMGGATAGYALFHNTDNFGTFCLLSPPLLGDLDPDYANPELHNKNIFVGYGDYDFVVMRSVYHLLPDETGDLVRLANRVEGSAMEYLFGLSSENVYTTSLNLPYGHDWVLWRKLIVHIFDNVIW